MAKLLKKIIIPIVAAIFGRILLYKSLINLNKASRNLEIYRKNLSSKSGDKMEGSNNRSGERV